MSNIRVLDPAKIRPNMRPIPPQQDLRLGRIMSPEEARTAMLRARRMQAHAIASFLVSCARWLRGNPASRVQRISDSMSVAGR
jgi:hypothetical protein